MVYELNCLENQDGSLSPNSKFLSRGVRSYLPNSLSKEVDRRALVERRQAVQERIANRKGNKSRDSFGIGDRVRVKSNLDGRWTTRGTVQEARPSGSSSPPASFLILTDSGQEILHHKSYIKHAIIDTGLDNENQSATGPVGNDGLVTPAEPDPNPTGQDITPSGSDPAKPALGNVWEQRLRPRKA